MSEIEVRRSRRRTKTVQAFRENGRTVVAIPDRFTAAEEAEWVARMVERLERRRRRQRPSDTELAARAERPSQRYLEGRARPSAAASASYPRTRGGTRTPAPGSIRPADHVSGTPGRGASPGGTSRCGRGPRRSPG